MKEFTRVLDELTAEVQVIRGSTPLRPQDVQRLASTLVEAQLVLNDLERVEARNRRGSRWTAERFQAQEGRIRALQNDLYMYMNQRREKGSPALTST